MSSLAALALVGCTIGDDASTPASTPTTASVAPEPTSGGPSTVAAPDGQQSGTDETAGAEISTVPDGNPTPARPGSAEVAVDPELFRNSGADGDGYFLTSPSGNISCGIYPTPGAAGPVGCQAVTSVAPVDGPTCSNAENDKHAVRIEPAGAVHFCTTQGIYTAPDAAVLQYGEILTVGDASCVSREEGVSCLLAGSNAVLMSREANLTY